MIDEAIASGSLAIVPTTIPTAVAPAKTISAVGNVGRNLFIVSAVVLILPAIVVFGLVALLVPCFFRVPVFGPAIRTAKITSKR